MTLDTAVTSKLEPQRRAFIEVTPDLIIQLLKVAPEGVRVGDLMIHAIEDPIPETALALRAGITERGNVIIVIQDASFEPVVEGQPLPRLDTVFNASPLEDTWEGTAR